MHVICEIEDASEQTTKHPFQPFRYRFNSFRICYKEQKCIEFAHMNKRPVETKTPQCIRQKLRPYCASIFLEQDKRNKYLTICSDSQQRSKPSIQLRFNADWYGIPW